jgi:hypothetical protein
MTREVTSDFSDYSLSEGAMAHAAGAGISIVYNVKLVMSGSTMLINLL